MDDNVNTADQQFNNTDGDDYGQGGEDYNEDQDYNQDPDNQGGEDQDYQNNQVENNQGQNNYRQNNTGKFGQAKRYRNNFRNDRYNNAYGNYSGGYGPPGGFNNFRPRGNFYPQNNFGPPPMFQQPPGNFSWGRGFGPGGPPIRKNTKEDKTIRYLLRCGVGKDNVKNLPRDLLVLFEPEYCGLCAQSLDSYPISRIHYISKNHLKNQKKWLSQQSEMGFRRGKEIPLKSRDLYCELCDVHITSKVHSDSHYMGKAHRSIVEGNKKPKNPFLLQQGMEDRVEQLIRREKKHMKTSDETTDDKPVDAKAVQSELYCNICKTSVTCTDQMTMHLNGKRHLAKEKQHILKMMKDNGNDKPEAAEPEPEEEEPQEAQDTMEVENANKEEENVEDNYDWENGGEKWDEAPKED